MAGLYGGTMTVGELLEHGDLGLGTLDSIDGELIVLDGKAYQAKGSGEQPELWKCHQMPLFLTLQWYRIRQRSFSDSALR